MMATYMDAAVEELELVEETHTAIGKMYGACKVVSILDSGGMGYVFLATRNGQRVALKVPRDEKCDESQSNTLARFRREINLLSRLDHQYIPKLLEHGEAHGLPYFAMELVDGVPLSDMFPSTLRAYDIIRKAATAVHHMHQRGVIHRDLKPGNILVRDINGEPSVIDLGLAHDTTGLEPPIDEESIWIGTPAFSPPEQVLGRSSYVDPRSDVYSLATALYWTLTRNFPRGNEYSTVSKSFRDKIEVAKVGTILKGCPEKVEQVICKGMEIDPDNRYQTAQEFADALQA